MKAVYQYNAGATAANIRDDLIAIFTGETTVANLSASCNKSTTTITSVVAAGWTLHDGAASATSKVIKAPYADDGATFKYAEISIPDNSGVRMFGYETFNATAHTGTNKTANSSGIFQYLDVTNGGKFYLFSSARFLMICAETKTAWGDNQLTTYSGPFLIAEHSRISPWNTVASGYPAFCFISMAMVNYGSFSTSYVPMYSPRFKNRANADLTGTSAILWGSSICGYNQFNDVNSFPQGVDAKVYDSNGNLQIPFLPLYCNSPSLTVIPMGDFSSISDIWLAPANVMANFETITKDSNNYIAIRYGHTSNGHRILVRNE
jgi:hypothetical protein